MSKKAPVKRGAAYEVIGFEMIDPNDLVPHPAAYIPIDEEDVASIDRSIYEQGILHPLLVSEPADDDANRDIYDGVNRWKTALSQGLEQVPCLVVRCDNPAMIVAESLAAGRKRSTGQRIMVFLEAHSEAVLDARRMGREIGKGGKDNFRNVQQNAGVSRDRPGEIDYTPDGIATLLKCSNKDVICALELFEALHTRMVPDNLSSGKRSHEADEGELEMLSEQRNAVLSGHSPVRVWKRAFFGKQSTRGEARAPIDYASLLDRSLTGLLTALPRWAEMDHRDRAIFEEKFAKVMNALPDDLKVLTK